MLNYIIIEYFHTFMFFTHCPLRYKNRYILIYLSIADSSEVLTEWKWCAAGDLAGCNISLMIPKVTNKNKT